MSVRSEVQTKLASFASSQTPPIPVAYENVEFIKPKTGQWLEIYFLASGNVNRTVDASSYWEHGAFQINCCDELGVGAGGLEGLAQKIVDLFPVVPKTGTVSVESTPDVGRLMIVDDYAMIPVTVYYRVEH